jgi:hypothetical protein
LRTNDVGASSGTLRAWRSFIPLSTSTPASSSLAAGAAFMVSACSRVGV